MAISLVYNFHVFYLFSEVCSAGEFMLDDVCEPCELGFYQDELGQTSCKPCPLGQTTHMEGTDSLAGCIGEKCCVTFYVTRRCV